MDATSDNHLGLRPDGDVEFEHLHQIEKAPEKARVFDALDLAFLGSFSDRVCQVPLPSSDFFTDCRYQKVLGRWPGSIELSGTVIACECSDDFQYLKSPSSM